MPCTLSLPPTAVRTVRAAMSSGYINRWAYTALFREVIANSAVISFDPNLLVAPERQSLQKKLDQP